MIPKGPTPDRLEHLECMLHILARNAKACDLATTIWRFFGCRLKCAIVVDENRSRIDYGIPRRYAPVHRAAEITPIISLAKTERMEEALVHELLHLELVRLGYPRFFFDGTGKRSLARGISNNADHVVMRPLFINLGYSLDRFVSYNELNEHEKRVIAEIDSLPNMHIPEGYSVAVSAYLNQHGIRHRLVYVRS